jgi:hypothetical protein
MMKIGFEEPEPLTRIQPTLPAEVAALVHDLLAKNPDKRPTMEQARDRLDALLGIKARPVALVLRPTAEIGVLAITPPQPSSLPEMSGNLATADAADGPSATPPAAGLALAPSGAATAPPALAGRGQSVGERATQPQPLDAALHSSVGRGTGQQLTGAGTRAKRQQQRRVMTVGFSLLLLATSAVTSWQILRPATPLHPAKSGAAPVTLAPPQALAPAPLPQETSMPAPAPIAANDVTAVSLASSALTAPRPVMNKLPAVDGNPGNMSTMGIMGSMGKDHRRAPCVAVPPTEACLLGELSEDMKQEFLSALDDADIKLCNSDWLTVVSRPNLAVTSASGVRKVKQQHFEMALRGAARPIAFPGEVIVRCKGR